MSRSSPPRVPLAGASGPGAREPDKAIEFGWLKHPESAPQAPAIGAEECGRYGNESAIGSSQPHLIVSAYSPFILNYFQARKDFFSAIWPRAETSGTPKSRRGWGVPGHGTHFLSVTWQSQPCRSSGWFRSRLAFSRWPPIRGSLLTRGARLPAPASDSGRNH